jgi:4,5-dihydroxyphthalate decarboxylase
MPDVELSLALSYYDHVSDLLRGKVRAEGIRLLVSGLPVEEIFFRQILFGEWDVSELSMAKYVSLVGACNPPFRAIPVFPSRVFRQSAVYLSKRANITKPGELAGRRVGIPEWSQTAGIYARAFLQHQCGVALRDIHWVQAGVNQPGRIEKVKLFLPGGVTINQERDRTLNDMLLSGDLDAAISARPPAAFLAGDPRIVRLWPNYREVEESYYRDTGIFPIMHAIVIKSAVLDARPWIATNLFKAFEQAKRNSLDVLADFATARLPFAWAHDAFAQARAVFGADPWPYGIEPNRKTLESFLQYSYEQGTTDRRVAVEELFPRELGAFFAV